jgi:transcriptional regulator with XRE-family HTH domain
VALTESVSAKVREELKSRDISFRELARRMGVSQPYISRRLGEEPEVDLKLDEIEKIAVALDVPVDRFLSAATDEPVAGVA